MLHLKKISLALLAGASLSLGVSTVSFAGPSDNFYSSEEDIAQGKYTDLGSFSDRMRRTGPGAGELGLGSALFYSDTASYFFKVGVYNYERGNLEKAEKAFEAVIRTHELTQQSYYYLARIGAKQDDEAKTLKYVKAYHGAG